MSNPIRLVKVRFLGQSRPGTFLTGDLPIKYGERVVAMSERGMAIGFVNSDPFDLRISESMNDLQRINKIATEEDINQYKNVYQEQRDVSHVFKQLVTQHNLEMKLDRVEFTSLGKKIVFYYTSPTRVDFRDLLRDLSKRFKERIELRQIPKNESATSGTIGPCGMELCLFIKSVIHEDGGSKSGCSEFNCCLDYKDPFYEDKRTRLPRVGDYITTYTGEMGRVERLDLWKEQFEMVTDQGVVKRYVSNQLKEILNKKSVQFPSQFESISNETKMVIGLDSIETAKNIALELESANYQVSNKNFTEKNFELLFGKTTLDFALPEIDE